MESNFVTYVTTLNNITNYAKTIREFEHQHGPTLTRAMWKSQETGNNYILLSTEELSEQEVEEAIDQHIINQN